VSCDYVERRRRGRLPKFTCEVAPGDNVKVKFGSGNGEVYAEVAATRLLWALGFGADRMYPVRVLCRGCPIRRWRERDGSQRDPKRCIGNLPRSLTGTLDNPAISEPGRRFLADLLVQLSDAQLLDLFEAARFPLRSRHGVGSGPGASADEWLNAFKHKRDEVVNRRCPDKNRD
jgi:hypothetical protein